MGSPTRIAAFVAIAVLSASGIASAQIVVINARGPSASAYPQGSILPPSRVINLKAGDQLEVLVSTGSRVLSGPIVLPAGQVDMGTKVALGDIFKKANASRPGIAAVRGFSLVQEEPPAPPQGPPLWRLDVTAWQQAEPMDVHNFCVMPGQPLALTRDDFASEGKLSIYQERTRSTRVVVWPAGARALAWPTDLPTDDGSSYGLNLDAAGATTVNWRTVRAGATSLTELASELLSNGCYDQIDSLQAQFAAK